MNRERAKELLPIIEAYANGEDIEFRLSDLEAGADGPIEWLVMPGNELMTLTFPCDDYEYRIKLKPREFYLNPESKYPDTYTTIACGNPGAGWIKVREIL